MDYLKILKDGDDTSNKLWNEAYKENGNTNCLQHMHVCDFEILNCRIGKSGRNINRENIRCCKEYLKSIGETRDKDLWCCEKCIHDKYVTTDFSGNFILNIATLAVNKRINPWET